MRRLNGFKSNSGISLAVLVVTIFVLMILVSTITITGIDTANNAKKLKFASEIKMLQQAANNYIAKNDGQLPVGEFAVIDLSDESVTQNVLNQFVNNSEDVVDDKVSLSVIDYEKLGINSLAYGMRQNGNDDIYAISNKTKKIYYLKGLKIGNDKYYTLTDELENLLNYNQKSNVVDNNKAVVFVPDKVEWVNTDVNVKVKVPANYTNVSVKVGNTSFNKVDEQTELDYHIYNVTYNGNYTINVSYNLNGDSKKVSYDVLNVDKEVPSFKVKKSDITTSDNYFIEIISINETGSGVKVIKYDNIKNENNNIGKSYFDNNGIKVENNLIKLDNSVDYITIYMEDNAGNYTIMQVDSAKL